MKNYHYVIFSLLIVSVLLVATMPKVQASGYLPNPFKLKHTPTLCEIEPENEKTPFLGIMMLSTTHDSVNEWLTQLNQGLGNKTVWNINEVQIPPSIQNGYNYTNCDIQMRYYPEPHNKTDVFETDATITYDKKNSKASVIIYYQEIQQKLEPSSNYGFEYVPQYSENVTSYYRLKQIISHEIGHALGLAHYHETNQELMKKWISGEELPPSIMVEVQGANAKNFGVTQMDVNQIKLKYGQNGFGVQKAFGVPHETSPSIQNQITQPVFSQQAKCPNDNSVTAGSAELLRNDNSKTGMSVFYTYSPVDLYRGCTNLWTFDFLDEKNTTKHLSNIYYDVIVQQDFMRSIAHEYGQYYFFTKNGTGTFGINVKERESVVYYWVVVYSTPPQKYQEGKVEGGALVFLNVAYRSLPKTTYAPQISPWMKDVARWWSVGQINDSDFISAVQYLIQVKLINVNKTQSEYPATSHIPSWLRTDAGKWANGHISDNEFVQEIQLMVDKRNIKP